MSEDVVVIGGARTPFCEWLGGKRGDGEAGGRLADVTAEQLGSIAIRGALQKTGTSPESVDHLVMGHALQTSDQAIFGARHAGLNAGIPQEVPMLTLNRLCGSGIQSIISASQMIMLGEADTVVAGGMENLSQAPHVLRGLRSTYKLGRPPREGDELSKDMEDYLFTNLYAGESEMRLAVGGDHAGFSMKGPVIEYLQSKGHEVIDYGTYSEDPVDFPDITEQVTSAILSNKVKRGILVCGTGVGAAIAGNKVPGIRAAVTHDTYCAHQGVEHDDVNLICMGAWIIGLSVAKEVLDAFLNAKFSSDPNFKRRVSKLSQMELKYAKQLLSKG